MSDASMTTLQGGEGKDAGDEATRARERAQDLLQGMNTFLEQSRKIDRRVWAAITLSMGFMSLAVWLSESIFSLGLANRVPHPQLSLGFGLLMLAVGLYPVFFQRIRRPDALAMAICLCLAYLVIVYINGVLPVIFAGAGIAVFHVLARPNAALALAGISLLASAPLVLGRAENFDQYPQLFRALAGGFLVLVFLQFVSRSNRRFRREAFKVTHGLRDLVEAQGRSLDEAMRLRGRAEQALRRALYVENQLKKVGAQLQDAVQSMPQGLVMVIADGHIVLRNPQAAQILGVPEAYLAAGRLFEDLLHLHSTRGELGSFFRGHGKRACTEGKEETPALLTNVLRLRDGRHVSMSSQRMLSGHIVHTYSEVTDYVIANEELQTSMMGLSLAKQQLQTELQRSKEESDMKLRFVTAVSHEIRTPLNGIMGIVELLSRSTLDSVQVQWIEDAKTSTRQLHRLTDDILDLSLIRDSKFSLSTTAFNLGEVLAKTVRAAQAAAALAGIRLELQMVDAGVQVVGDAQRLTQIINNLVYNAIKFTAQGLVRVHVEARSPDPADNSMEVVLSVADSGRGISANVLASIFEPFHQGEETVNRNFGGSGLGLTLSRELCEAMGGGIRVTSRLGRGSVFTATVMLKAADPDVSIMESQPGGLNSDDLQTHLSLEGKRILVVDDNRINQKLIHAWLSPTGAWVEAASDGAVGLRAASTRYYDCILMDMSMPVMNGLDATRAIRKLGNSDTDEARRFASVPIIGVTAMARREDRMLCLEAGMDAHMGKPLERGKLLRTLREVMEAHRWLSEANWSTPSQHASLRFEDEGGLRDA